MKASPRRWQDGVGRASTLADTASARAWRNAPGWVKVLYLALLAWVLAALPLLTKGYWLEWNLLPYWRASVDRLSIAVTLLAVAGYLMSAEIRLHVMRQPPAKVLLGLVVLTGLLHLGVWGTARQAAVLMVMATGAHHVETGVVREILEGDYDDDYCRREAVVQWRQAGEQDHCLSKVAAEPLAVGMPVHRSVWTGAPGSVRSTLVLPPQGLSLRAGLMQLHLSLRLLVMFVGVPVSMFLAVNLLLGDGKRRFIWLGIMAGAWAVLHWIPLFL